MKRNQSESLLNRKQAAEYLNFQPKTLSVWASTKRYPLKNIKIGSRVFYSKTHLDEFIEMNTFLGRKSNE